MVKRVVVILVLVMAAAVIGIQVLGASTKESPPTVIIHPAPAYQAFSTRSLHSVRMLTPPTVDGDLSDWPVNDSIDVNRNTAFTFSGRIDGTADLSAIVRSGWDDTTLYFAIRVRDDIVVTDSTDVWRDDGVEIGLDGVHDEYAWGFDDHQYTIVAEGRTTDRAVPTTDIGTAVLAYAGGYSIEVAIPMSQLLPGVPISATIMGFTIGIHDDDDGGNWDAYLIWEGTNTSSLVEQFGDLVFVDRPEDRLAALEARIVQLERQVRELLIILTEFEQLTLP